MAVRQLGDAPTCRVSKMKTFEARTGITLFLMRFCIIVCVALLGSTLQSVAAEDSTSNLYLRSLSVCVQAKQSEVGHNVSHIVGTVPLDYMGGKSLAKEFRQRGKEFPSNRDQADKELA